MDKNNSLNCRKNVINELKLSFMKIKDTYKYIKVLSNEGEEIIGSGEWLLDNIYLIEKEYKAIRTNMPRAYFENLVIEEESSGRVPRIFILAREMIRENKGRVTEEEAISFILEKNKRLNMGELWAFPLMLRASLIINISKVTDELKSIYKDRKEGRELAYKVISVKNNENRLNILEKINDRSKVFTEEFYKVLKDNSIEDEEVYNIAVSKVDKDKQDKNLIRSSFMEGSLEDTIGSSIASLREIDGINWRRFFSETSIVEKTLMKDPDRTYGKMDFKSKDYYRHKIEKISRKYKIEEELIAEKLVFLAERARESGKIGCKSHIGYYLIDDGIRQLNKELGSRVNIKNKFSPNMFWLINVIGTLLIIFIVLSLGYLSGIEYERHQYILAGIILIIPASEIVVNIINWITCKMVPMRHVPKIDLRNGIGEAQKSVVIVPTIINSINSAKEMVKKLEVIYLANKEDNLYFAILADFPDSDNEIKENDKIINEITIREINRLNRKYCIDTGDKFFFLNRQRIYNSHEGVFMGRERKRGKIMEFIALLKGEENEHTFNVISSSVEELRSAKYIITLDSDTFMPRGVVKKLIGAMMHPLNRAVYKDNVVKRGYTIMQPKVSISLESKNKSEFSKIFGGEGGVDGYSTAYSDTYQDLFGEGSFTGKGIIDIDVFYRVLKDEIHENKVLSHDLLEGCYTRSALVTDCELIDNYPSSYLASAKRLHRWVRGDWQLLPWLFSSKLSMLSKWKIFDNLRRSLLAPSLMIGVGITLLLLNRGIEVTILLFLALIMPLLFTITDFVVTPKNKLIGTIKTLRQIVFIISFIPYQTYIMIGAILKALFRLFISKNHLLEWQTAEDAERTVKNTIGYHYEKMWFSVIAGALFIVISFRSSLILGVIISILSIVWILSPALAYKISKIHKEEKVNLSDNERDYLRCISRRTWAYYEDFVNSENNYLAPDNYQEKPYKGVANRTSPTNMGMGLISNIVAYDLGYIPFGEVVDRIENILNGMNKLEKYEGHYLNWYDTKTAMPLWPRYVSTVDSGNLLGYLWVLKETLKEYKKKPLIRKEELTGLKDIYRILKIDSDATLERLDREDGKEYILVLEDELKKVKKIKEENKDRDEEFKYWIDKLENEIKTKIDYADYFFDGVNKILSEYFKKKSPSLLELKEEIKGMAEYSGEDFKNILNEKIIELESFEDRVDNLILNIESIMDEMNFSILYQKDRELFSIGYNLEEDSLGNSYYDLLASEARITSFLAIARNEVDTSHWFKLGRAMTNAFRGKSLVSWSGTMFEYFMPNLLMKSYKGTLLDLTYRSVIKAQIAFARKKKVPWGISESAYYQFDIGENYQYKAFGVPGIGLKRGLEDEIVVSPYSTLMVLPWAKDRCIENLKLLESQGALGRYGFIEAIDFTPNRINKILSEEVILDDQTDEIVEELEDKQINKQVKVVDDYEDYEENDTEGKSRRIRSGGKKVKCYMVHHLGMSFLSLDNILNDNILQKRFHDIPEIKATEILLKEKVPEYITFERDIEVHHERKRLETEDFVKRVYKGALRDNPEVLLLSNGTFSSMITLTGSGYSKRGEELLYRWKGDTTSDSSGLFFYIKNLNSNDYWSATYEPCKSEGEDYTVEFSIDKGEFSKKEGSIESKMEIVVSPEDNLDIRKITLRNTGDKGRSIEITSYMEITLASFEGDSAHPSFSNLFIETEYDNESSTLLGKRRARVPSGKVPYIFHKAITSSDLEGSASYETSRINFIGRNRTLKSPVALDNDNSLKNTVGIVLDPIMSIRNGIRLDANEEKVIYFITGVADDREEAIRIANDYSDVNRLDSVFRIYNKSMQVQLRNLGIKSSQANIYQSLASYILFLNDGREDREEYIRNINKHQKDLWAYGISGDIKIAMLVVKDDDDIDIIRSMIKMHNYFISKGLKVDLIIYNQEELSYEQPLQKSILQLINTLSDGEILNKPGGIFIHNKASMSEEIRDFIIGISSIYINSEKGTILTQMKGLEEKRETTRRHKELSENNVTKVDIHDNSIGGNGDYNYDFDNKISDNDYEVGNQHEENNEIEEIKKNLDFFNGYGGFDNSDGSYVIILEDYNNTPAPWINVISNENFGFHISEIGSSHTWCGNSRENKITPWNNDWVQDTLGEAIYVRDNKDGRYFSITPKPVRDEGTYIIRHSFGYSSFKHTSCGIKSTMTTFCPKEERVKIQKVILENTSEEERDISVFYYAQLVLGVLNYQTARYISTYNKGNYIYGKNPYSEYFGRLKAYSTILGGESLSFTCDRREFIGISGSLEEPLGLKYENLQESFGSVLDPCLVTQCNIKLKPGETKELIILLGEEEDEKGIEKIIEKYNNVSNADEELDRVKKYWGDFLGNIRVKTQDKSMDYLLNGWLLYQNYSCRYLARTAFYQSGGAYGFRDQLQDSMSIGLIDPKITKDQIIRSASRQYLEGDVQHWWHPIINSGIRTRFSDDLLWLPFVTAEYIDFTGDYSILNEKAPYLEDEPLREGEDERYTIVNQSRTEGTIYEHCIKAIERGLRFGDHGIPLMGSGDWNDGMSTVGNEGKGESVWLGWFLYKILTSFEEICIHMNDNEKKDRYIKMKEYIRENLEKNAWDGGWYRRAYFDNGMPLGSRENGECKIDSLAQSWSIISEGGNLDRAKEAMEAVDRNLVDENLALIKLLAPPFANSKEEPGYIKGYVAGVRENGGQYTHAATWVILALTKLGMGDKALRYFDMINPINHTNTELECRRYKLEPYVMAADVYIREPHGGRGGWSWYTGTAGWMYKVGLENILGFKVYRGEGYKITPCVPKSWKEFEININREKEEYNIKVIKSDKDKIIINGKEIDGDIIPKNLGKANIELYYKEK
ncbi:GH36-type glycosyl hydrolase domain-containing protein [Clostridium sardiniense]|uniref:GH36-type glycosyl hydrolase domain-containing protein n=1 Tax=Clostridium sardiniense TaxID=29369 RepID=UPI003D3587F7